MRLKSQKNTHSYMMDLDQEKSNARTLGNLYIKKNKASTQKQFENVYFCKKYEYTFVFFR